ncbi:uncharacterized protein G2W53_000599 [Senna tora]|uniref:Uncharacterized protein n=1 Tax=Senna tora TaxID=362788 RepID=A0A834XG14_9FABA|nr:uncharacterized protein G2W53_000599 [Senna tora]
MYYPHNLFAVFLLFSFFCGDRDNWVELGLLLLLSVNMYNLRMDDPGLVSLVLLVFFFVAAGVQGTVYNVTCPGVALGAVTLTTVLNCQASKLVLLRSIYLIEIVIGLWSLEEPVSHIVARPSPNDILEWRKFALQSFILFRVVYVDAVARKGEELMVEEELDDNVFEDDDLTWQDVAIASGAEEPLRYSRKRSSTQAPTPRMAKKAALASSSSTLRDLDEEEENSEETEEEEEIEGWKKIIFVKLP